MSQLLSGLTKNPKRLPDTKRRGLSRRMRDSLILLMLCLPGLICIIIWNYVPMFGVLVAFKNYAPRKGIIGSDWVGLKYFMYFFKSQDAWRTIRNTLLYSIDFLVTGLVAGVGVALMLYYLRGRIPLKIYHTTILIPQFISINIIAFMVFAVLNPAAGLLNRVIEAFGGEGPLWYNDPKYWPVILTIVNLWCGLGSGSLYYYSALMSIDKSLFEAASIDGAGTLKQCRHIALPHLTSIICMMTILGLGNIFSGSLGLHREITMQTGSLLPTVDIIDYYTYRSLLSGDLVRSAAVSLFQNLVGLVLVITVNKIVDKISPENSMF